MDPSSWLISFEGIGPLTIAGRISEERASMTAFLEQPEGLCDLAEFTSDSAPDITVAFRYPETIETIVAFDTIESLHAVTASPKTEAGVGVGSTPDEVRNAHPDAIESVSDGHGHYFTLTNGDGRWIHFAMTEDNQVVQRVVVNTSVSPPHELCA